MKPIRIEVCVDDLDGLNQAVAGGADRIELCARLDLDGLTPTQDLLSNVAALTIPVRAMIRPAPGPFTANSQTLGTMIEQIALCRLAGCDGVVFGLLDDAGQLDQANLARLCDAAKGLGKTLHRAVDQLSDPCGSVALARNLGFDTMLSSGGASTAMDGIETLKTMIDASACGFCVMPGAGVSPANVAHIAKKTGAPWIHGSFRNQDGHTDAAIVQEAKRNANSF